MSLICLTKLHNLTDQLREKEIQKKPEKEREKCSAGDSFYSVIFPLKVELMHFLFNKVSFLLLYFMVFLTFFYAIYKHYFLILNILKTADTFSIDNF